MKPITFTAKIPDEFLQLCIKIGEHPPHLAARLMLWYVREREGKAQPATPPPAHRLKWN